MTHQIVEAKDYNYLLGNLEGFSDELLKQHFELYNGYIKSVNEINEKIANLKEKKGNPSYSEYRSLLSFKAFPQNGVVLHEFYFSNLSSKKTSPSQKLIAFINHEFNSFDECINDLKEAAKSVRSGWVILGYDERQAKIQNSIIDLHDEHVPFLNIPLLVLDVWEHAYTVDYGINKAAYLDAFISNIDWDMVSKRLDNVCTQDIC